RHFLHGDGLSWRACHHRLDVPDRVSAACLSWTFHADAASWLRVCRLVLALRRRRLDLSVFLHLCVGFGRGERRACCRPLERGLDALSGSSNFWLARIGSSTCEAVFELI